MFTTGAGLAVLTAALMGLVVGVAVVAQTICAATMDHVREYGTLKGVGATNGYYGRPTAGSKKHETAHESNSAYILALIIHPYFAICRHMGS